MSTKKTSKTTGKETLDKKTKRKAKKHDTEASTTTQDHQSSPQTEHEPTPTNPKAVPTTKSPTTADEEQAFTDYYMQTLAKEFADDLDKIRSAPDFRGEQSVAVLVEALKQGTSCFPSEERVRYGRRLIQGQHPA